MSDKKKDAPVPIRESGGGSKGDTGLNRQKDGKQANLGFTLTTKPPPKPKGK